MVANTGSAAAPGSCVAGVTLFSIFGFTILYVALAMPETLSDSLLTYGNDFRAIISSIHSLAPLSSLGILKSSTDASFRLRLILCSFILEPV